MRFTIPIALLLTLVSSSAIPEPEPAPAPDAVLEKRDDNWCRTVTDLWCRKGPGRSYDWIQVEGADTIPTWKRFGVRCTIDGDNIEGDSTWDWIPGWGCWVSAYYTRTAGNQPQCESGLPQCW